MSRTGPILDSARHLLSDLVSSKQITNQYANSFIGGLRHYLATGITPFETYLQHRQLYYLSRGTYPLRLRAAYSSLFPIQECDLAGKKEAAQINCCVLEQDGYLILPDYFGDLKCLHEISSHLNSQMTEVNSARISADPKECLKAEIFKRVTSDSLIASTVARYLRCTPIIDLVCAWRLVPMRQSYTGMGGDALLYHIDLDRTDFLKVFVYLTDVDEGCGPHCYVPHTHLSNLPDGVRQDRRYNDEEVLNLCPREPVVITGGKGTVIIANTHCLHKGTLPVDAHRDIFQVEYCNSLFGATYSKNIFAINQHLFRDVQFTGTSRP